MCMCCKCMHMCVYVHVCVYVCVCVCVCVCVHCCTQARMVGSFTQCILVHSYKGVLIYLCEPNIQ